ncbi:hypothetical protein Vadar_009285 [Vaccinium darrowii]|uniref:Uncharacterized protein n=1 Tax=Vaccinium darrowii TaxID=229202 RepID=A0ACB7YKX1_9ERIC|nr:hypothetical protein Vadar_009285 [Vaccinium darrowii]
MFILKNGVEVSVHADSVAEHLFLVVEKGVGAEVVGEIDSLIDSGATIAALLVQVRSPATPSAELHIVERRETAIEEGERPGI